MLFGYPVLGFCLKPPNLENGMSLCCPEPVLMGTILRPEDPLVALGGITLELQVSLGRPRSQLLGFLLTPSEY